MPLFLPLVGRVRADDDRDEDQEERAEDHTGTDEETDRVPVIPWSDEDGDADSWDAGDLPWGKTDDDDDPDDPDPDDRGPSDDLDDGNWDDLGWADRQNPGEPEPAPVEDGFALPAMSSWQRRKSDPATTSRTENLRSGGVEPPPEELEQLWARRRAEADARREELRQLRESRRRDESEDKDKKNDDEPEKEIVTGSSELLRQSDGVWGAGHEESGVIG